MALHVVGTRAEIPPGSRKIVEVEGRSIGVFNVAGEFLAIRNRCPHQGAPLCLGEQFGILESDTPGRYVLRGRDEMVRCPWHGWEFNLRTGQSWFDPERTRVRRYDVRLDAAGREPGPYVAETFPAGHDGTHVYVEL